MKIKPEGSTRNEGVARPSTSETSDERTTSKPAPRAPGKDPRDLPAQLLTAIQDLAKAHEDARLFAEEHAHQSAMKAHEMRTPLHAVLGYAQLIEMQSAEPVTQQNAQRILKAGKHLLHLINQVLVMAKSAPDRAPDVLETVQLPFLISEAVELMQPVADQANIKILMVESGFRNVQVRADPRRLFQVLLNLLTNAVNYNRPGGRIEIRCAQWPNGIRRIEIQDNGVGITPEDQALLFRPYQRVGSQRGAGSGLGLAISRGFMELMGGNLGLVRSDSRGSTFYIDVQDAGQPALRSTG